MIRAQFIERKNRFTVKVKLDGEIVAAHLANSGRLEELLCYGQEVYLEKRDNPKRATQYDLVLVRFNSRLVSIDARVPNDVVSKAVNSNELREFSGFKVIKREVKYGSSRLDLLLQNNCNTKCFVEVKSVTLVDNGTAMFPDAPTQRGTRHLEELIKIVTAGNRAAVIFLVQREDAFVFSPNYRTDPGFADTLKTAFEQGVEVYAYICSVSLDSIKIVDSIPINFGSVAI